LFLEQSIEAENLLLGIREKQKGDWEHKKNEYELLEKIVESSKNDPNYANELSKMELFSAKIKSLSEIDIQAEIEKKISRITKSYTEADIEFQVARIEVIREIRREIDEIEHEIDEGKPSTTRSRLELPGGNSISEDTETPTG
jgi:S-adenosylmethionine synthetase